jgi:hypothetical protein
LLIHHFSKAFLSTTIVDFVFELYLFGLLIQHYNYPILLIDNLNNSFLSKVRENALKQKADSIAGAEREKLERF